MALDTVGLNEAYTRKQAGTANATDVANLAYATSKGWKYQAPTVNSAVKTPDQPKTATGTPVMITGYDQSGKPVQVPKGVYVPGVSLTPPKTVDAAKVVDTSAADALAKAKAQNQSLADQQKTAGDTAASDTYSTNLTNLANEIKANLTKTFTPEQEAQNKTALLNKQNEIKNFNLATNKAVSNVDFNPNLLTSQVGQSQAQIQREAAFTSSALSNEEANLINMVNLSDSEKQAVINGDISIASIQDKIQTHVDAAKQSVLDQAKLLDTQHQQELATALEAYKGIDVDKLTAEQTATFSKIITDAGLDPKLVFQGIKAVNAQQTLDNTLKTASAQIDTATKKIGTDSNGNDLYYDPTTKKTGTAETLGLTPAQVDNSTDIVGNGSVSIPTTSRIASVHNNPGNLIYNGQAGATQGEAKLDANGNPTGAYWAKFATPEDGFKALVNDITGKMTGNTSTGLNGNSSLQDLVNKYAPASDRNNPVGYAATLAKNLGVSVNTKLNDLLPRVNDVSKFIANVESGAKIDDSKLNSTNNDKYAQYGLLANTDFNPKNEVDKNAKLYLDYYLKNGTMPSAYSLGMGKTSAAGNKFTNAQERAQDLYFKATGSSLPDINILKDNKKIVTDNNKVLNKNAILSDTVKKNFDLAINGEITNDINQNATVVNQLLNPLYLAMGNPAVSAAMVSNGTISQEFANLISIRNASGTTVSDKEVANELIKFGTSVDAQKEVVKRLEAEALNIKTTLQQQNSYLYSIVDPLQTDPNNPNRQGAMSNNSNNNTPSANDPLGLGI